LTAQAAGTQGKTPAPNTPAPKTPPPKTPGGQAPAKADARDEAPAEQDLAPEQALEEEIKLLDGPTGQLIEQLSDSMFMDAAQLEAIDKGEKNGALTDLPPRVAKRLAVWRQMRAAETAAAHAPWQKGPRTVKVAGPISLDVPQGYKYLDVAGANTVRRAVGLANSNQSVLAKEDESFVANIVAVQSGHYSETQLRVDLPSVLDALKAHYNDPLRQARTPLSFDDEAKWLDEPKVDMQRHILSWANSVPGGQEARSKVLRFGRTWTLEFSPADTLNGLASAMETTRKLAAENVTFAPGETYADAVADDPQATKSIADVISGGPSLFQVGMKNMIERTEHEREFKIGSVLWKALPMLGVLLLLLSRLIAGSGKKALSSKPEAGQGSHQNGVQEATPSSAAGTSGTQPAAQKTSQAESTQIDQGDVR